MSTIYRFSASVAFGLASVAACAAGGTAGEPAATPRIMQQGFDAVRPYLEARCTSCHSGADADAGLSLRSWDDVMAGSRYGEAVIAFDPANSRLYEMVTGLVGGPHPAEVGEDTLASQGVMAIRDWIAEGARSETGEVPFADADNLLYVAMQGAAKVTIIDMDRDVVTRNVELQGLGFTASSRPHYTVVEPDGSHWYVSLIGDNRVLRFDSENHLVGDVEFERPGLMAVDPANELVYVGRSMAAVNPPQRIGVIEADRMAIDEIDVFFPRPHALAVTKDGRHVFTASLAVNQIGTVSAETGELTLTTLGEGGGGRPHVLVQFAISPDGSTMVVGGEVTGKMLFLDITDAPELSVIDSLSVDAAPWHPAFTPDGRYLYFGNNRANTVTVVDMSDRSIRAIIEGEGLAQPHGIAISPEGSKVYVSNRNQNGEYRPRHDFGDNANAGTVVVIDTSTNEIVKVIEVEEYPAGMNGTR